MNFKINISRTKFYFYLKKNSKKFRKENVPVSIYTYIQYFPENFILGKE